MEHSSIVWDIIEHLGTSWNIVEYCGIFQHMTEQGYIRLVWKLIEGHRRQ